MITKLIRMALLVLSLTMASGALAGVKGIYLTSYSVENTTFFNYLIKNAKASGIDTFVVDYDGPSKRFNQNIALLKENNIKWVARIVMFDGGGTREQIKTPEIWQKKYTLVKQAVDLGANEIQLDYIRYNTKQKPSAENAKDILTIIQWYKNKLASQNIPLQVDVFGIASYGESKYIGQNIQMFSQVVDAICPMVYPSHYTPFAKHYATPYETIYDSLTRIQDQFEHDKTPVKMYAYIELSNYHYKMTKDQKIAYIKAQIRAVNAAEADGWYAWSPHNRYENLFHVLQNEKLGNDHENQNKVSASAKTSSPDEKKLSENN